MVQIDMDMPVGCFDCPIREGTLTITGKYKHYCGFTKKKLSDKTKRHESCPLIEVKEGE